MSSYIEKWRAAADDILAVMLVKADAWEDAIEYGVSEQDMPAGPWRQVYHVIFTLRGDQLKDEHAHAILMDTQVAAKCDQTVSVEWVAERIAMWDELREMGFSKTCQLLITYARGHRQFEALNMGAQRLVTALNMAGDPDEVTESVVDDLRAERRPTGQVSVDIADLSDEAHAAMSQPNEAVIQTGIWLIDEWLRGLTAGEFVAFPAAYKMRKTSVLANILINMARAKKRALFYSYDESRMRVTNRIRAVLMAEYMWNNGHWNLHAQDGTPLNVVDGKMIRNAGERWRMWPKPLFNAYEYACDVMGTMRGYLSVYDQSTGLGGLKSIRSIAMAEAMRGGDIAFSAVDHIQRVPGFERTPNATYSAVEYGSSGLHEIGQSLGMVMWVLSQINEEAIRNNSSADNYTPNAKGGGGIASNADTVITSRYKVGDITDPRYLRLDLKLAREGEAPLSGYVEIHPASGWITPRRVEAKQINLAKTGGDNV